MKPLLRILAVLLFCAPISFAVTPQPYAPGSLTASCAAVTTTGECTPLYLPGNSLAIGVTWQLAFDTGTAASVNVTLRGSNDNVSFTVLDTSTSTSNNSRSLTVTSYRYLECNVVTYSRGTTNNLTCSLTVNPNGGTALGVHGTITPGDCTSWFNSTTLEDLGFPCGSGSGGVTSVSGTDHQIDVSNGTTTPGISLDPAIVLPGSIQFGTTTTSRINDCTGSEVWVEHANGTCINYAASSYGSSAAAALSAACLAASDGDNIFLAAGTFDFGTLTSATDNTKGCDLSKGGTITASIHGQGPLTIVKRSVTLSPNAPIIAFGLSHSRITDLKIIAAETAAAGLTDVPILNRLSSSGSAYYDVTDAGIERVIVDAKSDCYIVTPVTASSGYAKDFNCTSQWDSNTWNGSTGTVSWVLDNTTTAVSPDAFNNIATCYRSTISSGGVTLTFRNANTCVVTGSNASANIKAFDFENTGTNSANVGPGLVIDTSGVTAASTIYDLNNNSLSTITMTGDSVYNKSRVKNLGTINYCQDQFSCPAQTTGGIIGESGVGASTWTNGSLIPFSDAGSTLYAVSPMDMWLVNPTLTTSNSNGSAALQAQISFNLAATNTRQPWVTSIAPGAAAGTYRDTTLPPLRIANGIPFDIAGVNSIPANGTALATVRGWTANIVGTQNTVLGAYISSLLAASAQKYMGFSQNQLQATEAPAQTIMSTPYSISEFCVYLSTTNGAAGSLVITLDKNTSPTALVLTIPISGGSGVWCTTGTAITGSAGDLIDFGIKNNDASNNSGTIVGILAQDKPTLPSTGQLTFGLTSSTLTSGQLNNVPPFSGVASTTTILNTQVGLPRAVQIRNLYCNTTTCPGAAASATVFKNGVATALTVTIPTSSCTTTSDTTHIISFAAGDQISLQETSASSTAPVITSCSVEHD